MWKVLLVEDEVFVRESIMEIIEWGKLGFMVVGEAGNGIEALDIITKEKPHLVITDIVMPEMDGIELLKTTRQLGYASKFVMLTCMSDVDYAIQAMEYGASSYILKLSMNVADLRSTLKKISAEFEESDQGNQGWVQHAVFKETNHAFSSDYELTSHPEVNKIMDYIHQNYDQDITVKSMANYVTMGENYVSAIFKQKIGQTFIRYLHEIRITKAIHILETTNLPIYQISEKVGFSNDNYFIKIFKRFTGLTPSQYREKQRAEIHASTIDE